MTACASPKRRAPRACVSSWTRGLGWCTSGRATCRCCPKQMKPCAAPAGFSATPDGGDMTARERIAVIGAGLMGTGIAQTFAVAGHEVALFDPSADALARAPGIIANNLRDLGRAPLDPQRLTLHASLAAA